MNYRRSQSGVALVITLIMLSVITLIAVAFLALSQRERSSISSTMTATEAEAMANAALNRAHGDILAQMSSFIATNINAAGQLTRLALGPDLSVSLTGTNTYNNLTNMGTADYQVLTNLLYDPSPPVFSTNRIGSYEHVGYIDLNRNGRFDPTGWFDVLDSNGNPTGQTNFVIGDPQWIGVTARPNEPHSSSNRFIGRYAYLIIPVGRTLDVDFIHSNGKQAVPAPLSGFYRHDGHGSWEINLAAFLTDLNTNQWTYPPPPNGYNPDINVASRGTGFDDAREILSFRYRGALPSAQDIFGSAASIFEQDGIDQFANGAGAENDVANTPWPGAPNAQHFFSLHDFFNDKSTNYPGFTNHLFLASTKNDSFNRYTFYRMLAQLATDSAPEKRQVRRQPNGDFVDNARINLNYDNLAPSTAERFTNWSAETFFHTTADRLLRTYGFADNNNNPLSVTNLPVWRIEGGAPTNYYTPAVHRILQMTLNIFDAMTNRTDGAFEYPFYPTALRPLFQKRPNGEVFIIGYQEVLPGNAMQVTNALYWRDLNDPNDRNNLQKDDFVYGVPILIGAKKGYPNFNQFTFQTDIQFERRVQVWKDAGASLPTHAAQMFFVGVSNSFGLEAWNSYSNAFTRPLEMFTGLEVNSSLSNDEGFQTTNSYSISDYRGPSMNPLPIPWPGGQFRGVGPAANKLWTNQVVVPYRVYKDGQLLPGTNIWDVDFTMPQWVLSNSVHVRFFLFDKGHLVDAVGLAPVNLSTNITASIAGSGYYASLWATNKVRGQGSLQAITMTRGVETQLGISQGAVTFGNIPWDNFGNWNNTTLAQSGFRTFLTVASNSPVAITNQGFTPQIKVYRRIDWRANDPLVHHMDEDLRRDRESKPLFTGASTLFAGKRLVFDLGETNSPEYAPWRPDPSGDLSKTVLYANPFNTDPNITSSDAWDFPTNEYASIKFPSIGWLGRVHRGTPWQTIYLKPAAAHLPVDPTFNNWGQVHHSMRAHPTNDWKLADIFTVAPHPNASRGRMSVNQTNLAGWSAVLSGIEIPMADSGGSVVTNIIEPAVNDPRLDQLVTAINGRRQQLPGEVFSSLAEFVSVPELTLASPYLMSGGTTFAPQNRPLGDADYEALLEKILSLVKPGEPRFLIYAFGQSLKPAPQSILTDRDFLRLCINYEVTGELATRAVMRVDMVPVQNPPAGQPAVRPQAVIESFNILPPD
jgi:hypothetical protein